MHKLSHHNLPCQEPLYFANFIKSQTLSHDEILVLFDVVSLFTNIPVSLATSIARTHLLQDETLGDCTQLTAEEVFTLLEFCLEATYLAYKGISRLLAEPWGPPYQWLTLSWRI